MKHTVTIMVIVLLATVLCMIGGTDTAAKVPVVGSELPDTYTADGYLIEITLRVARYGHYTTDYVEVKSSMEHNPPFVRINGADLTCELVTNAWDKYCNEHYIP